MQEAAGVARLLPLLPSTTSGLWGWVASSKLQHVCSNLYLRCAAAAPISTKPSCGSMVSTTARYLLPPTKCQPV